MENNDKQVATSNPKRKENSNRDDYRFGQYMTPEWEQRHAELVEEENASILPKEQYKDNGTVRFVHVSFRRFEKTAEDRAVVKKAKRSHRAECRKYGVNHKKQINVTINDVLEAEKHLGKKFNVIAKKENKK